jgi:hypothetical protein
LVYITLVYDWYAGQEETSILTGIPDSHLPE